MAEFEPAVAVVLENEGGYTDDPNDHGGETNFGITWADLKLAIADDIVPRETTIKNLTREQAIVIYKKYYWDLLRLYSIGSQKIANKILDSSVLGGGYGVICLQQALNHVCDAELDEDGILGLLTINAINRFHDRESSILISYRSELAGHSRAIVLSRPNQEVFLKGWLKRDYQ